MFVNSVAQGLVSDSPAAPVGIRPDMDNMFVANPLGLSGLHPAQRQTMAMYWIGAGANLFEGGDLTRMDSLGEKLLHDPAVYGTGGVLVSVATFHLLTLSSSFVDTRSRLANLKHHQLRKDFATTRCSRATPSPRLVARLTGRGSPAVATRSSCRPGSLVRGLVASELHSSKNAKQ